jgi:methylenetetrahydrofolate dehydrogenase (NADP+)/methenyltetrahydrofolate cyclohydrolase
MANLLLAKEVTDAMAQTLRKRASALQAAGVRPTLALLRCGSDAADLSYERGILAKAAQAGVSLRQIVLPPDVTAQVLAAQLDALSADPGVHGVLLFRPLPVHLRALQNAIFAHLCPEKDVDGMTALSAAGVFTGQPLGFAPCTPEACLAILDHYGIDCAGKNAVVLGRSAVVGRPLSMLLLSRSATVTVCHTKTEHLAHIARDAELLFSAMGARGALTAAFVNPRQILVDVSVNFDPETGHMTGDADFSQVAPLVRAITPVPGGVGGVTGMVLMRHVLQAAEAVTFA